MRHTEHVMSCPAELTFVNLTMCWCERHQGYVVRAVVLAHAKDEQGRHHRLWDTETFVPSNEFADRNFTRLISGIAERVRESEQNAAQGIYQPVL